MPFIYPTSVEMREIEPDLISRGRAGRIGLDIMPSRTVNAAKVRWSQKDNYYGLQQFRGLDGAPVHVVRVGQKTFEYEPGIFGEYVDITETELTVRAGSIVDIAATPIDVSDIVSESDDLLICRELDRMESSVWTLLTTGVLKITMDGPNGTQVAYSDSYAFQVVSATVPWSTSATAAPVRNFQTVQQLGQAAGHSVDFGAGATAYMNTFTWNNLLNNSNANDIDGRRQNFGATLNNLNDVNQYLTSQNLPKIVAYDAGYIDRIGGFFTKFIPNNVVVVVGSRPSGAKVGEYQLTRNASNGYRPGSYRYVLDRANGSNVGTAIAEKRTPANIEVHRGHNGGPAIYYPSAIAVMNV